MLAGFTVVFIKEFFVFTDPNAFILLFLPSTNGQHAIRHLLSFDESFPWLYGSCLVSYYESRMYKYKHRDEDLKLAVSSDNLCYIISFTINMIQ